ncbi:Molybdenum cofactor guanylyltransferase [uncultured archaeon]|nr:Molybdenum cofactor guanylyltransferase [uncultured archaeon]
MSFSALILAGGKGSRLGYREKALIDINGKPLIMFVIESLEKVVDSIIISVRDKAQGEFLDSRLHSLTKPHESDGYRVNQQRYRLAYDSYINKGPLAGIFSGLSACDDEYCFIAACDMPFINEDAVKLLIMKSEGYDAAIPRWDDGFLEPLHAVYRRGPMMRETKKALEKNETIILAPIFRLNVNYVATDEIKSIEPDLRTFMNVNTPEDIQQVIRKKSL